MALDRIALGRSPVCGTPVDQIARLRRNRHSYSDDRHRRERHLFTLIDDAMLRSLPVQRPDELVKLGYRGPNVNHFMDGQSLLVIDHLRQHTSSLLDVAAWSGTSLVSIPDDRGTLRAIEGEMVSGNALSLLGVKPHLGRLLTPADDVAGGPEGGWPVVLDFSFWLANYHGDPDVVGKHLRISLHEATIVGVLPSSFGGLDIGSPAKVYLPAHFLTQLAGSPEHDPYVHPEVPNWLALGRLRSGVSLSALNAELAAVSPSVTHTLLPPFVLADHTFRQARLAAESASRGFSGPGKDFDQLLFLLQGMVLLVLLLCCLNLSGLQLARVQARQHEFAVRAALGAGRRRIVQQCMVESMLLAAIGSLVAAAAAWFSTGAMAAFLTPSNSAEPTLLRPDISILLFSSVLALVATLFFGLTPAFVAVRGVHAALLKENDTHKRGNTLHQRFFVSAQFALALTLVFAAGLFLQTAVRLRSSHAGFDPAHIMEVSTQFHSLKRSPNEIAATYRSMIETLRASPEIEGAAYTWVTPLTGFAPQAIVHSMEQPDTDHSIAFNEVGDGYFATIRTKILAGREFTHDDRDRSTCVLNQSAARMLFAGSPVIGASLKASSAQEHFAVTCRVVGLVEDSRYSSLRAPAPPTLYFAAGTPLLTAGGYANDLTFLIRSRTVAEATTAYRAVLTLYAPDTAYSAFRPFSDQVDRSIGNERRLAVLSGAFAAIALLLSAVGICGVLALRVQQRTPELGIRIAIGATRRHLLGLVLREAMTMVAIGSIPGIALAALVGVLVCHFLYETKAANIPVAAGALCTLLFVALAGALIPAIRAAYLDPTQALRNE
jgi:predicted permease